MVPPGMFCLFLWDRSLDQSWFGLDFKLQASPSVITRMPVDRKFRDIFLSLMTAAEPQQDSFADEAPCRRGGRKPSVMGVPRHNITQASSQAHSIAQKWKGKWHSATEI